MKDSFLCQRATKRCIGWGKTTKSCVTALFDKLEFSEFLVFYNSNKNPATINPVRIKENSIPKIVRAICTLFFMWSL